ncbi:MAG TPA: PqiC family protein [Burkholderiaceae bacterium]|nr:PqiC family protein [Burkholderiaceae bacterium]
MNLFRVLISVVAAGFVAGCSTTQPSQYYTLMPPSIKQTDAVAAKGKSPGYAISVQHVALPEQVDRPQIVITDPDSTQVTPLNSSLWASPLSDEVRNALADALSRRLGVLEISPSAAPESLPIWRITLTIQRFESLYGRRAVLDATWRLTPLNQRGKKARLCRAEMQVAVADGMSAMVAGHREALHAFADVIADQIQGRNTTEAPTGFQMKGCTTL